MSILSILKIFRLVFSVELLEFTEFLVFFQSHYLDSIFQSLTLVVMCTAQVLEEINFICDSIILKYVIQTQLHLNCASIILVFITYIY